MATMIREDMSAFDAQREESENRLINRAYDVASTMLRASPFDDTDATNGPAEVDCDGVWIPVRVYVRNEDMDDNGQQALDWQKVEHERRVRREDRAYASDRLVSILDVQRVLDAMVDRQCWELASAILRGDGRAIVELTHTEQQRQAVEA